MDGPRSPSEEEFPQLVSFLQQNLRTGVSWSISEEYPLAIHPANLVNMRIIKDHDQFLSGAVAKNIIIRNPMGIFKVAAIGSVVTDPNHRNQGLSRAILESCVTAARSQRCDFAILWSDLHEFYRKVGFEVAGTEVSFVIDTPLNCPSQDLRFVESNKVAAEAIARLYGNHTCGTIRTAEDIRKYLQIPNSRVYTAWDSAGALKAYAVEGKGADLGGYVHEWGGGVSSLLPLLNHIRSTHGSNIRILVPGHSQNLIQKLTELGAVRHDGVLGMIKILNPTHLLAKIKRYARHMGVDRLVLEMRDNQFYFGHGQQIFRTDSEIDMVRLLFGPYKASQLHNFDPETTKVLESILPIPMWVWGWDSV